MAVNINIHIDLFSVKYHCMKISNVEKCDVKEMKYP